MKPTVRARPLQVRELVLAAVEHLEAAALAGLAKRYPPTRLLATVAGEDYRSLAPFLDAIASELALAYAALGAREGFELLAPELEFELLDSGAGRAGQPPRLRSEFPQGDATAHWLPTGAEKGQSGPADEEASGLPALELLLTASTGGGTARQSRALVVLAPELPLALRALAHRAAVVGAVAPFVAGVPLDQNLRTALAGEVRRIALAGNGALYWAPAGALSLGRRSGFAHLIPSDAPANLSGRHFAFVREASGRLAAVDLGSTNGTFLEGRKLEAGRTEPLPLPARLEIGREGALSIHVRQTTTEPSR